MAARTVMTDDSRRLPLRDECFSELRCPAERSAAKAAASCGAIAQSGGPCPENRGVDQPHNLTQEGIPQEPNHMINPLRQRMSDDDWSAVAVPRHVATIWRLNVWHLRSRRSCSRRCVLRRSGARRGEDPEGARDFNNLLQLSAFSTSKFAGETDADVADCYPPRQNSSGRSRS
jgi:hypothetical protein